MIIGQSGRRLVRLIPSAPCVTNCIRVADIHMVGKGPAYCNQGSDHVRATLAVTDEAGNSPSNALITAHFFDDYWLDQVVAGQRMPADRLRSDTMGPRAWEPLQSSSPTRPLIRAGPSTERRES